MRDIKESEARGLLSISLDCVDIGDWIASNRSGYIFRLECGLLHDGAFTQLHLELIHSYRPDTRVTHMKFCVFRKTPYGLERVFQLDVNNNPKAGKNSHNLPHCHWGDKRICGERNWLTWGYQDALRYFIEQTGIRFAPMPELPDFKLK